MVSRLRPGSETGVRQLSWTHGFLFVLSRKERCGVFCFCFSNGFGDSHSTCYLEQHAE